jgi:RNA polymerase sigma-70 factor, ECF subfamily
MGERSPVNPTSASFAASAWSRTQNKPETLEFAMNCRSHLAKNAESAAADFEHLFALLPLLRRVALKLTRNPHDCEDLVQDVLLKVVEHRDRLADVQMLKPWLMRVVYHQFIDGYRRNAPLRNSVSLSEFADLEFSEHYDSPLDLETACGDQPDARFQQLQVDEAVRAAISRLPRDQQVLVDMHEIQGLSVPHIARQLSMSVNTIKSSLARARAGLRRRLDPMLEPDGGRAPAVRYKPVVHADARRLAAAG